jgi:hypothetical protein
MRLLRSRCHGVFPEGGVVGGKKFDSSAKPWVPTWRPVPSHRSRKPPSVSTTFVPRAVARQGTPVRSPPFAPPPLYRLPMCDRRGPYEDRCDRFKVIRRGERGLEPKLLTHALPYHVIFVLA